MHKYCDDHPSLVCMASSAGDSACRFLHIASHYLVGVIYISSSINFVKNRFGFFTRVCSVDHSGLPPDFSSAHGIGDDDRDEVNTWGHRI